MTVLPGVDGQLASRELAGRPPLVERVRQHVVAGAHGIELGPEIH
jgi:hypothetical protein